MKTTINFLENDSIIMKISKESENEVGLLKKLGQLKHNKTILATTVAGSRFFGQNLMEVTLIMSIRNS